MTKVLSINDLLSPCTDASPTSEGSRDEAISTEPSYSINGSKRQEEPIVTPLATSLEAENEKHSHDSKAPDFKVESTDGVPGSCPVAGALPSIRKRKRVPVSCNTCRHRKIKVGISLIRKRTQMN